MRTADNTRMWVKCQMLGSSSAYSEWKNTAHTYDFVPVLVVCFFFCFMFLGFFFFSDSVVDSCVFVAFLMFIVLIFFFLNNTINKIYLKKEEYRADLS